MAPRAVNWGLSVVGCIEGSTGGALHFMLIGLAMMLSAENLVKVERKTRLNPVSLIYSWLTGWFLTCVNSACLHPD